MRRFVLVVAMLLSFGAADAVAGPGALRATTTTASQAQGPRQPWIRRIFSRPQRQNNLSWRVRRNIKHSAASLERTLLNKATPPFKLIAHSKSVRMKQTRFGNYKASITPAYTVSGLSSSGELNLSALLPVSGHTGQAKEFAKSNVYNVSVRHADGTTQTFDKISATGLVTEKILKLNLKPGKTIINFWPDHSAGVAGFRSGREIELNWSGN